MLKAIPTVILLAILYVYLKIVLFGPLDKVLKQRSELTEGTRQAAEASLARAEQREQEYQQKFAAARSDVYKLQEETRRQWLEEQTSQVAAARARSEAAVRAAKQEIAQEAAAARANLNETSAQLAEQIANAVLARRAGGAS
jgi:F-type H+-transporting ATPase subunit b